MMPRISPLLDSGHTATVMGVLPPGPPEARRPRSTHLAARVPVRSAGPCALPRLVGYRVERRVGQGRRSQVYLAEDLLRGGQVVLKVVERRLRNSLLHGAAWIQEFTIPSEIRHEHVIRVFDQACEGDFAYIAMEYLDGGHLGEWIRRGLSPPEAVSLLRQAARALTEVHRQGVVHRDVKPANLLLHAGGSLVLADFGLARRLGGEALPLQPGQLEGTPCYVSPEQAQGGAVLAAADVYSLGVVFYEMLCGKTPYPGSTLMEVLSQHLMAPIPRLPEALSRFQPLIDAMLAKAPGHRLPDGQAVVDCIDCLAGAGFPTRADPSH